MDSKKTLKGNRNLENTADASKLLAELRDRETRLSAFFQGAPVPTFVIDQDHRVRRWNRAMEALSGIRASEVLGTTEHWRAFYPDSRPCLADLLLDSDQEAIHRWFGEKRVQPGLIDEALETTDFFPGLGKTGKWLRATASVIRDPRGKVLGAVETLEDITERKQAERETQKLQSRLIQAQKMESVGQLAGGVAHDFNNMLTVILGHAELALEKAGPDHPLYEDLREIYQAAERSADLTRQLLAFARKQTIRPRVIDLNETVEGALKMLPRLIGENIELIWRPAPRLWPVKLDPSQVGQILTNLCVNAKDAMPGGGKLVIETGNRVLDADYCAVHPGFLPGEYAFLMVSDTGCGMRPEVRAKVFEPFFTTKEMGRGTGLGLATVYGIVKQNNGFINVYSEPGIGTVFKIYMPRHERHDVPEPAVQAEAPGINGSETVLLVEDEPAILKMTRAMLEGMGYKVISAENPALALSLARDYKGKIHLLITDVVMPGMNGRELSERLKESHPDMKILFVSGYTANAIAHYGVLDEGLHFIEKPFSRIDLEKKIREVLGRGLE